MAAIIEHFSYIWKVFFVLKHTKKKSKRAVRNEMYLSQNFISHYMSGF